MSKGKFALGAMIGAAAGVVAGMLTAPKSGKENRADLKAKADDLRSEATKQAELVRKQAEGHYGEVKKTVDDYRSRAERAVSSAKDEIKKEDAKRK